MNTNKVILKPLFQKKADPLTLLLKDIFKDNRNAMSYLGALSIGLGFSQTDSAFAEEDVEEVVVTASKREANLQDLPMAVQAITSEELEAKNISDFNDIIFGCFFNFCIFCKGGSNEHKQSYSKTAFSKKS